MSRTELNLDQLLADMAEDVPEMPADFHDRWMSAVREDAKQAEAPAPAPVSQWPRILGVAAVFVFLIGGTFAYRAARKTIRPEDAAVGTAAMTEAVDTAGAVMQEAAVEEAAMEEPMMEAADMEEDAGSGAGSEDYSAAAPAAEAPARKETGKAAEADKAADALFMSAAATDTAAAGVPVNGAVMEAAEEEEVAEMAEEAAEEAVIEEPAAEAPVTTGSPAAETQISGLSATEVPESAQAERLGIGGFFADMGDFLLAVWPYLLIAAVPLAVAAGIRKFRKK